MKFLPLIKGWFGYEHQKVNRVGKQMLSIKGLSETRWVYHYRCAHALHECFSSVIHTLEKVVQDKKSLPNQKASCTGILLQLQNWKFIFWFHVLMEILSSINHLNTLLQMKEDTLWEALGEVETCRGIIKKLRSNTGFMKVWKEASEFAKLHNIVSPNLSHRLDIHTGKRKRIAKSFPNFVAHAPDGMSQSQDDTRTVHSAHKSKFFEVIDNLLVDFDKRFNKECIAIIDATKCLHPFDNFASFQEDDLKKLYQHYEEDFKDHFDFKLILTEHTHYKTMLQKEFTKKELKEMTFSKFNIWVYEKCMFKLVSIIPSSTATCERNFSTLNFIKNKTRNKMGDDFLDNLMLGYLEKDLVNKVLSNEESRERVVDVFKDLGYGSIGDDKSRKNYL